MFWVRRCCAAFLLPTNHAKQRENLRDRKSILFSFVCFVGINSRMLHLRLFGV